MQEDGLNLSKQNIPMWLLAELTYACPLQCPYCSNPTDFALRKQELSTEEWVKVLREARALGASQLGFSGGEPLLRKDLSDLVSEAHALGFYSNLITSAIGMDENRLADLKSNGLDSIQISLQAGNPELNDFLAGRKSFHHKVVMARKVKELGLPLTLNVVIHRQNIDTMKEILDLIVELKADYVELANTQYYGFAFHNRDYLLPTREQLINAEKIASEYKAKYEHQMKIYFVVPDYYENRPKACMNGWGKLFLTITADGFALPCHTARILPNFNFPKVTEHDLDFIWNKSEAFNRFRGYDWMKEPCRSCPERFKDFGGGRYQALSLTDDAAL